MLSDFAVCRPGSPQAAFGGWDHRSLKEFTLAAESSYRETRNCDPEYEEWNYHAHLLSLFKNDAGGD